MEVRYLQEFVHLAGTLSYSETAFHLHMSQSALSRHIQMLEKELGDLLFVRTTRSMALSEFGQIYLPYARGVVEAYDLGQQAVNEHQRQVKNSFPMGVIEDMEYFGIHRYIIEYRRLMPGIRIDMISGKIRDLERRYQGHEFNLYTAIDGPDAPFDHFIRAGKTEVAAIVSQTHPLAQQNDVRLEDLQAYSLFVPDQDSYFYNIILGKYKALGIRPQIRYAGNFASCRGFISEGMGVALYPRHYVEDPEGLKLLSFMPEISCVYGVGYRNEVSAAERAYLEFVAEHQNNK